MRSLLLLILLLAVACQSGPAQTDDALHTEDEAATAEGTESSQAHFDEDPAIDDFGSWSTNPSQELFAETLRESFFYMARMAITTCKCEQQIYGADEIECAPLSSISGEFDCITRMIMDVDVHGFDFGPVTSCLQDLHHNAVPCIDEADRLCEIDGQLDSSELMTCIDAFPDLVGGCLEDHITEDVGDHFSDSMDIHCHF